VPDRSHARRLVWPPELEMSTLAHRRAIAHRDECVRTDPPEESLGFCEDALTGASDRMIATNNICGFTGSSSGPPNGMRLSCGANLKFSQIEDYHSKTAPAASGAC
jgi:hypothetical protein